jgi:long-subunit fatty acid transport protein
MKFAVLVALVFGTTAARAAGPASPEPTPIALGRAGAVVADTSDLSALVYNPGAVGGLGLSAGGSFTITVRGGSFQGTGDATPRPNRAPADMLPFAAFAVPVGDKLVLAAGAYQAIGLSASYPICVASDPACTTHPSSFESLVFPVAAALRTRFVLVGAALSLRTAAFHGGDRSISEDPSPSASFGVVLFPSAPVRLAASIELPTDGHVLSLPTVARGALAVRRGRAEVELGGTWEGWSSLHVATPLRDTGSIHAGGEVAIAPDWLTARAGYAFERAALDDAGQTPELTDLSRHRLAVGLGGCAAIACVDLGYSHAFSASTVGGVGAAYGGYRAHYDAVSVGVRVRTAGQTW